MKICIKILLLSIILFLLIPKLELFGNYKTSCKSNIYIPSLIKRVLKEKNMKMTNNKWEYYLPCGYNNAENLIRELKNNKGKKIFMIDGCDWIASKTGIYKLVNNKYGLKSDELMPRTYDLNNDNELEQFRKKFLLLKKKNKNTKFIMKNFKQRQMGLKMVNNLKIIENLIKSGEYNLIQEYVNDPYLISGHKINFRYYFLIICRHNNIESYIFNDGFVYYTPKPFDKNSIDPKKNITTGYIDRKIYKKNPLTISDFHKTLTSVQKINWEAEIIKKFKMMVEALKPKLCKINKFKNSVRFQLFGADIAPSDKLKAQFMEINKGPDIGGKDKRDTKLKYKMLLGAFNLADINKKKMKNIENISKKNGYYKLN